MPELMANSAPTWMVFLGTQLRLDAPLDLNQQPSFVHIGTSRDPNLPRFFEGNLDDVAIWDRTLAPEEFTAIANPAST